MASHPRILPANTGSGAVSWLSLKRNIRDRETADVAIQAALTGHRVRSTLHTNDAPSAVTRLMDIGVAPFLISATLLNIAASKPGQGR